MTTPSASEGILGDARPGGLPYLTAELPGIGGRLKSIPEDFVVEEVPAYEPSGAGEHLFLWIEKTDTAGEELLRHVGHALGISPRDIGTAGVKDRRAVTRQFVSVPARCEPSLERIDTDRIRLLRSFRHGNKLRTGHLRGNRFSILVREVSGDACSTATTIAELIYRRGFPNYYGDQRFGHERETLSLGLELLRGTRRPASIPHSRRRFLLRLALSAVQSALFNAVLAERIRDGLLHTVLGGDVMQVATSGGKFVVNDAVAEQTRFDGRETLITGPMFGPEMIAPAEQVAEREARVLDAWQLSAEVFSRFSNLTAGTRRPLLVWPDELTIEPVASDLRVGFRLPSGAYATSLLREIMKAD